MGCPAQATPTLLDGFTCDGFELRATEAGERTAPPAGFLPEGRDCFGEEMDAEPFLNGDFTSSAGYDTGIRAPGYGTREVLVGLGWALALHVSLVLVAFFLPLVAPLPAAESQFITLNLVGAGGGGGNGSNGAPAGTGGAEEGASSPAAVQVPAPDRVASLQPAPEAREIPPPEKAPPSSIVPVPPEKAVPKEKPIPPKVCRPPKKQTAAALKKDPVKDAELVRSDAGDATASVRREAVVSGEGCAGPPVKGAGSGAPGIGDGAGAGPGAGGGSGATSGSGGGRGEFTLKQVEHPPVVLHKVEPHFPETARRMGITGRVVVKFLVKPDGHVDRASIVEVDPPGHFERCVLDALSQWKFKPGTYRGKAVATWVVQPIHFKLAK